MKARAQKFGLIALEAFGVAVAAVIALALFVVWRVQSGPVSLDLAAPALRASLNAAWLDGAVRRIESAELARAGAKGGYRLTIEGVEIGDRGAAASVRIPRVAATFFPSDLLQGRAGPRRILVEGAEARIVRRKDRRMAFDLGGGGDRIRSFRALTGGAYFREAFERAELKDATISFIDEASGRRWVGRRAGALIERSPSGYAARISGEFDVGAATADLDFNADYDLSTDKIIADVALVRAPVGDLIAIFFNQQTEFLSSLVTGRAAIELKGDGSVISSSLQGRAEGGAMRIGKFRTPVQSIDVDARFDPAANAFAIETVGWKTQAGAGAIKGSASLSQGPGGIEAVAFNVVGDAMSLDLPATLERPLSIAGLVAEGRYELAKKRFSLSAFDIGIDGAKLGGALAVSTTPSVVIDADLAFREPIDRATLLAVWPKALAQGARDFVVERISGARFSDIAIASKFDSARVGPDGALPDDALTITFGAAGASIIIAPGMTPLRDASGKGRLTGNTFRFDLTSADIGAVRLTNGGMLIPRLTPRGAMARFTFDADGDAAAMLSILNEPPLSVLAESGLSPSQFSGDAKARVEIGRPNVRIAAPEEYTYKGSATFAELDVDDLFGDISLEQATGGIALTTDGLKLTAGARAGSTPIDVTWTQRFRGGADKSKIVLSGVADSSTGDLFSIPTRRLVQGPVGFEAVILGDLGKFRRMDIDADFSQSLLIADQFGWMKPRAMEADGRFSVIWSADGSRDVAASVLGAGIDLRGRALISPEGAIIQASADSLKLVDAADATIDARRDAQGVMTVDISGAYLNAAPMIERFLDSGFGSSGGGETQYAVKAQFANVQLRGAAALGNASISLRKKGARYSAFDFVATDAQGRKVTVALDDGAGAGVQTVLAKSQDIGALIEGVFAISSIRGGAGTLQFDVFPGDVDGAHGPDGALNANDLRVVDAPLLAKVLGASSFTGLADIVNGEGIALDTAYARFSLDKGRMQIKAARAAGPSVGITAKGEVVLSGESRVALSGAVAPVYGLNSFLGNAPLIGDLFVSRKGEGVLAVSYEVEGPIGEPRITVNPLSALAPGVLRRMFEPDPTPPPTD